MAQVNRNDILNAIGSVQAEITDIKITFADLLRRMDRVTTILEDIRFKVGQTEPSTKKEEIVNVGEGIKLENTMDGGEKTQEISSDAHLPCVAGPSQLRYIDPYDEGFVRPENMSDEEIYLLDIVRADIGITGMEAMGCYVLQKEYDDRKPKHVSEHGVLSVNISHKFGEYTL